MIPSRRFIASSSLHLATVWLHAEHSFVTGVTFSWFVPKLAPQGLIA